MSETTPVDEIPRRIRDTLVEEYGDSQDRCVRGYVPTQSVMKLMDYLDPGNIQQVRGRRVVKDASETFGMVQQDLPPYIDGEEQIRREAVIDYDRAKHDGFEWGRVRDFLTDTELTDIAINKLVIRMENEGLRDHLFGLLTKGINYSESYKEEFTDPFYFVMESRAAEQDKDYRNIKDAHDSGYLEELGWKYRCLDLMAIWSHYGWVKSGNEPMTYRDGNGETVGMTQHEVEELSFNRRESNQPVYGAVNSPLVVNRWQTPFGSALTDMRHFEWREQEGWVRAQ